MTILYNADPFDRKTKTRPSMLYEYLDSGPSVTERLVVEAPVRDINSKRSEVQIMLDQWQAAFGTNAVIEEWQRHLDAAKTEDAVDELLRKLDEDLRQ